MDKDFINIIIKEAINAIHREITNIDKNTNSIIKDIEILIYKKQIEELKEYQLKLKLNIFNIKDLRLIIYRLDCLHQQTLEQWLEEDSRELYNDLKKILHNENNNIKRIALK